MDPLKCNWEELVKTTEIQVMTCSGCEPRPLIAAFDLDGTLIATKSGRVFPLNVNDWRLLYEPQVVTKLRALYEDNYKVVIITNQAGIATGKLSKADFRQKVESLVKLVKVPMQVFCSTSKNCVFRKPRPGAWEFLDKYKNGGLHIDLEKSFYCGDAAGRVRSKGKKDFSCSDRLFAANVGVAFKVPEEVFLGQKCTDAIAMPQFNPKGLLETPPALLEPEGSRLTSPNQEVVLMVGVQGSGKSFFAERYLGKQGYNVISNDKSGSRDRSLAQMKKALGNGKSVVVDNTHVNAEARQKFTEMARKFGVKCRCFVMNTSPSHVKHNVAYREIVDQDGHAHIGEALLNSYWSKYKPPTKEEGFSDIIKVNIVPEFKYEQHHTLYHMYLVEK